MSDKPTYLGDGVYAVLDGYMIKLMANDSQQPTDVIYLEPDVWDALVAWVESITGGGQP